MTENNTEAKCCENCKHKDMATVPFYVYEGTAYRFERSQKALMLVTVTSIILSLVVVAGATSVVKMAKAFGDALSGASFFFCKKLGKRY